MVRYPQKVAVDFNPVTHEWEVQSMFFSLYNITPRWTNCNFTWGWLDNETDTWTGAVGMIERDEADYAIWGFGATYLRSKVAYFSPPFDYAPDFWMTKYPEQLSPTWNLLGLFTKGKSPQMSLSYLFLSLSFSFIFQVLLLGSFVD